MCGDLSFASEHVNIFTLSLHPYSNKSWFPHGKQNEAANKPFALLEEIINSAAHILSGNTYKTQIHVQPLWVSVAFSLT